MKPLLLEAKFGARSAECGVEIPNSKLRALNSARPAPRLAFQVAHVLRKYNPAEWGGTETAVQRLTAGLRGHGIESIAYCPEIENISAVDPLAESGCKVNRFRAFLPVLGLSPAERRQQIAVGGNLMSFDLPPALWREPDISIIHTHALGRLGGIAATVARIRKLPLVVTIHGGFLDLPDCVRKDFHNSCARGWEWGKVFGLLLRSRRLLQHAHAILTCNPREAALLRENFPSKRIIVQPHGVPMNLYRKNCRERAREVFPQIHGRELLLCVGRIDSVKNQRWLVEEAPTIFQRHPNALLMFVGAITDENYGNALRTRIFELNLEKRVFLTGGLPPGDARLIGLFQSASAVLLPSISETFGLVILEAWAAGAPVIASRTSGASTLIREGLNSWLFDHGDSRAFQNAVDAALLNPNLAAQFAAEGNHLVTAGYSHNALAERMKNLYTQLIEEKYAPRHSA